MLAGLQQLLLSIRDLFSQVRKNSPFDEIVLAVKVRVAEVEDCVELLAQICAHHFIVVLNKRIVYLRKFIL